jgi:hypothetical protein
MISLQELSRCHNNPETVASLLVAMDWDKMLMKLYDAVNGQMQEMQMVREKIYALEQNQHSIKQR